MKISKSFFVVALFLVLSSTVQAATYTVTKTSDTADGVCNADCSLREAVVAANTNPGADWISVPAGVFELALTSGSDDQSYGDLDVEDDVTIDGRGVELTIIDANDLFRVLEFDGGVVATVQGLKIQNGNNTSSGSGILNSGNLTVSHCWIYANAAGSWDGGYGRGAGIYNAHGANMTIYSSTVSSNAANWGDYFEGGRGGGVHNAGTMTIGDSAITHNGALGDYSCGGAVYNSGALLLVNSTVSDSFADHAAGIYAYSSAVTSIVNTTIADSSSYGNYPPDAIGGWGSTPPAVQVKNSIIDGTCMDTEVSIISGGANLESPGNTCSFNAAGDLHGVFDPLIGVLVHNGGPTQTHSLLPGSPAINLSGSSFSCPFSDQRGVLRESGNCDSGAYEAARWFWDGFESGTTSHWSATVLNLADAFNVLVTGRGISYPYQSCTYDSGTGDYTYLGVTFNESDGGVGGISIDDLVDLYWKNEFIASTTSPYSDEDADGDSLINSNDADAFSNTVW